MAFEISPAVQRAANVAREKAAGRGLGLSDWVFGLLQDEDGKPASLLASAGRSTADVLNILSESSWLDESAPEESELFDIARDRGLALRADPTLTTDLLLLAVLETSREFSARIGVSAESIASQLRANDIGWNQAEAEPPVLESHARDVSDHRSAARVVDASLNRAREGLRVLEDYCRFILDDPNRTGQLKSLRHRLAAATEMLPGGLLMAARDTLGDVGTAVTAGAEYHRASPKEVARVNFKRLQEALRSAEEFGKLMDPNFARAVEQIRYSTYVCESVLTVSTDRREKLSHARLYLLVGADRCRHGLEHTVREAISGGVAVVQLREKSLSDRELLARAEVLRRITREAGVLFVVNDRPDIARLVGADGVHVGQEDLSVNAVRGLTGPDVLVGVSTHTLLQVRQAIADGADYIGLGPTFPSQTKTFEAFPGLPFIRAAAAVTELPAFALGGIDTQTISEAVEAGAKRVAVSSAILPAEDPRKIATHLRSRLTGS